MQKKNKPEHLVFGPLPVDEINLTLQLELDPGFVVISGNAQIHAARRHPDDFSRCLPHVAAIIENPLYLGDDARNPGKIELVGRVASLGGGLLVAIEITLDGDGLYNVTSFYPISNQKIEDRRQKGHLKSTKKSAAK